MYDVNLLLGAEAAELRKLYIYTFIETKCDYYKRNIEQCDLYPDGSYYVGYLWDCIRNRSIISAYQCEDYLQKIRGDIYVFWDLHSSHHILIPDYWKYPRSAVLRLNVATFFNIQHQLPEDIYVFDESLSWTISFTHEETKSGCRMCFIAHRT